MERRGTDLLLRESRNEFVVAEGLEITEVVEDLSCVLEEEDLILLAQTCFGED